MKNLPPREHILKVALVRFGHYGFNKTTMVEIASDCGMSAANIYRHFKSKNDILAVLATQLFNNETSRLSEISNGLFPDCSQKLHAFFQEALILTHRYVTEQPKIKEMVDFICMERFDLIHSQSEIKNKLIQNILDEGIECGEFFISSPEETADTIKKATMMFHTPQLMDIYNLEDLQSSCSNVVNLLLAAITHMKQD